MATEAKGTGQISTARGWQEQENTLGFLTKNLSDATDHALEGKFSTPILWYLAECWYISNYEPTSRVWPLSLTLMLE